MELLKNLLKILMLSLLRKNRVVKKECKTENLSLVNDAEGQEIAKQHCDIFVTLSSTLQKLERHVVKGGVQTS